MKPKFSFAWIVLTSVLLSALACSLPASLGGTNAVTPTAPAPGSTSASGSTTAPGATSVPLVTPTPKATSILPTATLVPTPKGPNAVPLPLRQGVSSLNSYRLKIHLLTTGPAKADRTEYTSLVEVNTKTDSSHSHIESIVSSADSSSPSTSISDSYTVGKKSCDVSGSAKTPTAKLATVDPFRNDMISTTSSLLDYNLYVESPVFAGEETVNGVVTNHFTFKVTRLGKDSGGVVGKNSGEYWVAKDGQYLVKYLVVLEMNSDKAGTSTLHAETAVELSGINQPIDITIPANCK